ncbi:MAG: hypothetical protein ACLFM0_11220 [Spirochaetales bacterium]
MLKKLALLLLIAMFIVPALSAQEKLEFDEFTGAFETLGEGVVNTLPHYNAIGLQWSDAYIGQLLRPIPNLGLGATLGAVTIPGSVISDTVEPFGVDLDSEGDIGEAIDRFGLPLPAYTVDARLGGVILPFDVGLKVGGADATFDFQGRELGLEYLLAGADVRYAVVEGGVVMPKITAGLGVNRSTMDVRIPGVLGENVELATFEAVDSDGNPKDYDLSLEDPSLGIGWESTSIDLKAQASKQFVFVEPFAGAALSYARSTVSGGARSDLLVNGDSYDELSSDEQDAIDKALEKEDIDADGASLGFSDAQNGWSARAFGGVGLRAIPFTAIDLGVSVDTTGSLGAQLNARLQL